MCSGQWNSFYILTLQQNCTDFRHQWLPARIRRAELQKWHWLHIISWNPIHSAPLLTENAISCWLLPYTCQGFPFLVLGKWKPCCQSKHLPPSWDELQRGLSSWLLPGDPVPASAQPGPSYLKHEVHQQVNKEQIFNLQLSKRWCGTFQPMLCANSDSRGVP